MTNGEIIASIIASLSLAVSLLTAYLTLLSRFKAKVLPKRRVVLTQVEATPCIVLECEFINQGAKPGSIEDILIKMSHVETGSQFLFAPFLVRDEFNIFENYDAPNFSAFSSVSLGSRERRELFVVFKPMLTKFEPTAGTVKVQTSIRLNSKNKWENSIVQFTLNLEDVVVENWANPAGMSQQIEAIEIGKERQDYFKKQT